MRPLPVLLIEQFIQRPVQAVAEQARAAFGREQGVFDQDGLAACQAQPPYLVDRGAHVDLQRGCGCGAGADFCCSKDPGSGDEAVTAQLLGEPGQHGEVLLDLRLSDERAAAAAHGSGDQAPLGQLG